MADLYRVEYTRVLYVMADSERAAEEEGVRAEPNEAELVGVCATPATEAVARGDADWLDSIPYSATVAPTGDKTVRELLREPDAD